MQLLCSARHPAGCDSLITVLKHIRDNNNDWEIVALIDIDILQRFQTKLSSRLKTVVTIPVQKLSVDELSTLVDQTIQTFNPDAALACSSGPDVSIDEVLLYRAKGRVRSFLIQDFWGDVNLGLGVTADTIFVCDGTAFELTKKKVNANIVVTGPLKQIVDEHEILIEPPIENFRDNRRRILIVGMSTVWDAPGYRENIESILFALRSVELTDQIVYRPHPLESEKNFRELEKMFAAADLDVTWERDSNIFNSILRTDLLITAYSSVGFDAVLYGSLYSRDVAKVIYWLHNPDLYAFFQRYTGLKRMPPAETKLALDVLPESQPELILKKAISNSWRFEVNDRIKKYVSLRTGPKTVVDNLIGLEA